MAVETMGSGHAQTAGATVTAGHTIAEVEATAIVTTAETEVRTTVEVGPVTATRQATLVREMARAGK